MVAKTINILGTEQKIERVSDAGLDLRGNSGMSFNLWHRILVSTDQGDEEAVSTLIHEILEAIVYRLNIPLGNSDEKEHVIRLFEAGLYQVVVENFPRFKKELEDLL